MYGQVGANILKQGLGGTFDLSAHIVNASTEFDVFTFGGTTFSLAFQGGFGASLKASLLVDAKSARIGGGGGVGPTGSFELRLRSDELR